MRYIEPKLELRCFAQTDIITTSGGTGYSGGFEPTATSEPGSSAANLAGSSANGADIVNASWDSMDPA